MFDITRCPNVCWDTWMPFCDSCHLYDDDGIAFGDKYTFQANEIRYGGIEYGSYVPDEETDKECSSFSGEA